MNEENIETEQAQNRADTGLICFTMVARFLGVPFDPEQVKHAYAIGPEGMGEIEMHRAAKEFNLKLKIANVKRERLANLNLPAIFETVDRQYMVLAKIEEGKYLIMNPLEQAPKLVDSEQFENIWSGRVILITQKGFKLKDDIFNLSWFIPAIWKYRRAFRDVLLASFTLQIIGLASPLITQVIVDKVLVHRGITTLDVLGIGLLIIIVFETVLSVAKSYIFTHTTNRIDVMLGARLFKHLFMLPLRYFEVRRVGDTIARVREVENIRNFLTGAPLTTALDVMFMVVYIVVMFFYSPLLTWLTIATLPLFVILSVVVTPMFKERLDEKFKYGAENQSYLVEAVNGIQTIKSFALEPQSQKKWEGIMANYVRAGFRTSMLSAVAGSIAQFVQKGGDLLILWIGARLVMDGKISVGQLIAFRMISGRVSGPVLRMVQMWQDFQQIRISVDRIGDIFNSKPEPAIDPSKTRLPAIRGNISFEGVRFRYRVDGTEIIRNVSFNINPGEVIGIVGRSGSGKSTISKLIQRLYVPEAGRIQIDGADILLAEPSWLRRQIGVVLQENFLFNGTVKENIAIHNPAASMEEVIGVAKIAGAHEFILELQEGYDTMVGEKGSSLSGGQRQRIAIARALLTNPRILIFDEATSALDYESESIIQQNLKKICHGRTVLIIAHRLSTLKDAHRIMTIEKGELVEFGTPQELLDKKGLFHYLYTQQGGMSRQ